MNDLRPSRSRDEGEEGELVTLYIKQTNENCIQESIERGQLSAQENIEQGNWTPLKTHLEDYWMNLNNLVSNRGLPHISRRFVVDTS